MSQESVNLVEDVASWSPETCRQRFHDALPVLISQYCNGESSAKKVAILKTMVASFQPILKAHEREKELFAPVMSQTRVLFGAICSSILTTLQEAAPSQTQCPALLQSLQLLVEIITSLETCVQNVLPSSGEVVSMDTIESLPSNVLSVIQRSFGHCKDSHTIYGDRFASVSEQLSVLFKRAYSLQKALMALLDVISETQEGDIHVLPNVCSGFHDLCSIISGMDTTLLISTWRFLVKLVTKHKHAIDSSFQVAPLVDSLCREVESHYCHALDKAPHPPREDEGGGRGSQEGDAKAFSRTLKVCSLCFKMLHHLAKEFMEECGEECGPSVAHVLLVLQSLVPPSLMVTSISERAVQEIQQSVLVGIEPLIQLFIASRRFCETLLTTNQDLPAEQALAHMLTLVTVLKLLPAVTDDARHMWLDPSLMPEDEPRDGLLPSLFSAFRRCFVELNLPVTVPGIMLSGRPQCNVSLYEHVITHLCGFAATLSERHFTVLESCLLRNILSHDWACVMVAMDVWCFVSRYGSAELCKQHVVFLFDLLTSVSTNHSPAYLHLILLLRRLIPLMAADHQLELFAVYPPERHAELWSRLPLPSFPDSVTNAVCGQLIKNCTQALNNWCGESSAKRDATSAEHLITSVECVQRLLTCCNSSPPITDSLTEPLALALDNFCAAVSLDKLSATVFGSIVAVSAHLLHQLKPDYILKLLRIANTTVKKDSPLTFRLACICLLRKLAKKALDDSPEQSSILEEIPKLFGTVLSDQNHLVHQHALEAFSSFAEETSHESVVPECIREDDIQARVVDFLNQLPAHADLVSRRTEVSLLKQEKEEMGKAGERLSVREETASLVKNIEEKEEEPQSKRLRADTEDEMRDAARTIREALVRLSGLRGGSSELPTWLSAELSSARQTLDGLIDPS